MLLLGDYGSRQRRLTQVFLVTIFDGNQELKLNLEIKTEDRWGLTCGREPLVVIALLKLLFARSDVLTGRASYTYEEVLKLLGWKDTKRSRDDIRDSIDINFIQSYNLSEKRDAPETPLFYLRRQHFITGYEFIESADDSDQWGEVAFYRGDFLIDFNPDFIYALRERSLLGIDWNRVTDVTRFHEIERLSEEPI